ncbi:hypothetical protein SRHO_G00165660 [Serrasalmus rhombeus]
MHSSTHSRAEMTPLIAATCKTAADYQRGDASWLTGSHTAVIYLSVLKCLQSQRGGKDTIRSAISATSISCPLFISFMAPPDTSCPSNFTTVSSSLSFLLLHKLTSPSQMRADSARREEDLKEEGEVDCWPLSCPVLPCEYTAVLDGECCPRCVSDPCLADNFAFDIRQTCRDPMGITRLSGAVWTTPTAPCTTCTCKNGSICCSVELDCLQNN